MIETAQKRIQQRRRKVRVRARIKGNRLQPRLSVFRANRHIYAQLIDDAAQTTLAAASSLGLPESASSSPHKKVAVARAVGTRIAQQALQLGITRVKFDRGGYRYHGRVRAVAEGAREAGLEF